MPYRGKKGRETGAYGTVTHKSQAGTPQAGQNGKLYVVATPIGNLGDITLRALDTLKEADVIAAEDTRVTAKLLFKYDIHTPVVSYHKNNFALRGGELVARLKGGDNVAVVSDAGMPCISDPGEHLVRLCHAGGVEVVVVPGACAAVSALALSGLSAARFTFVGFLSVTKRKRRECLNELAECTQTLIFYEAPHKLKQTLADLYEALGDRDCSLCRELTKIHEEVIRGKLTELSARYDDNINPKGEFVIVVAGKPHSGEPHSGKPRGNGNDSDSDNSDTPAGKAAALVRELVAGGVRRSDASKRAAALYGVRRSDIYNS